ncbi:MAG TPA: nickel pincer cofactor biosynthesis protein LarB [Anaerolineae bacterium]|nr:nickel pincer cofactor biosynthesis protein LarB [Anaerolineae bacterium]HQH39161.1 nickel pincer cofactor biosynthesis protein LarB [Anaerolineae bacterium]
MDENKLRELLLDVQAGRMDIAGAVERLRALPYDDVGHFARLDVHRELRQGVPETVFCQSKTPEQAAAILARLWQHHDRALGTRVPPDMAAFIQAQLPEAHYDATSRLITLERTARPSLPADAPYVMVVCGGTSDLPVAEEAAQTLEFLGQRVERAYDVGVAGLHRLLSEVERLQAAEVVIAVAGMEGALASVVAGLVASPVVAVPTSVGYGASFNGLAPLLTMLNSCAAGIAVVNIDNGYGAAIFAHFILRRR